MAVAHIHAIDQKQNLPKTLAAMMNDSRVITWPSKLSLKG
jgi:hypothetical protein